MNHRQLRVVFMGTPEFAVESLKALVENGYNVVGSSPLLISLQGGD